MKKEAKELARLLEREHGLQVGYDGRDHYVVRDPKRDYLVVGRFSATPSDHRWRDNAIQDLIKAGALKTDPYKAGGSVITEEKPHTSTLDVAAAMRAHDARTKHVKAEVERLFSELGHAEGMHGTNSSGIPTAFVRRAAAVAAENGEKRESTSLMTSLWQLRHDKKVAVGTLELFEKVIHEWDNNIGRPETHTPEVAKQRVRTMQEARSTNRSSKQPASTVTCEECGKEFDTTQGLNVHMVSHRIETCGLCGAEVPLNAMGQHMKSHRAASGIPEPVKAERPTRTYAAKTTLQKQRKKRAAAIVARVNELAAAGDVPAFADLAVEFMKGSEGQTRSKKKSNIQQTIGRIHAGAFKRLETRTMETFEEAFAAWDALNINTAVEKEIVKAEQTNDLIDRAEKTAETVKATQDDALSALVTLIQRAGDDAEATQAAKLLLKQLL